MSHLLANEAERHISETLAKIAASNAPLTERASGKIDMAYELGLIDYERRQVLVEQLQAIAAFRRGELRKARNDALLAESHN